MSNVFWSIKDNLYKNPVKSWAINIIRFIDHLIIIILLKQFFSLGLTTIIGIFVLFHIWPFSLIPTIRSANSTNSDSMSNSIFRQYWPISLIPTFGGDIYDFIDNGAFKFVLDKWKHKGIGCTHTNLRFVHLPVTLVYDGFLTRKILSCNVNEVSRGKSYERLSKFFGNGIFTSINHELWKHQRNSILMLFVKKHMEVITPSLSKTMFDTLDIQIKQDPILDLVTILSQMGLNGFCKTIFGVDVSDNSLVIIDPLNKILSYIGGVVEPFTFPFDPDYKSFIENKNIVHNWLLQLVTKAKKSPTCHQLIKKEFENDKLNEQQLIEFIFSIVLGGHETTARLMLGIVYSLCYDKSIVQKLNIESSEYFMTHNECQFDILKQPYLKKIIKEGTRLFPPVWLFSKEAKQDLQIDDCFLKKGTQILMSPIIFLRDKDIWGTDSETFDPDRFDYITDDQNKIFIPFVIGPENCPGKLFAELESSIVISKLFSNYDITVRDHVLNPCSGGTFRLTDKILVSIKKL